MKHEIIYTDDYALIVSDKHIKDVRPFMGQYHLEGGLTINKFPNYLTDLDACKLIIAHRPLTNAPILKGVPLLPEFEDDDFLNTGIQVVGDNKTMSVSNFLKKYGKETYKYTEKDLRKAIEMAITSKYDYKLEFYNQNEIIQSLQQSKRPKYFEYEMARITKFNGKPDYFEPNSKPNSQGQTELVGEYIYG